MTTKLVQIESAMQLPDLPKSRCINHPMVKAIRIRLCAECLKKWEKTVLNYENWLTEKSDDEYVGKRVRQQEISRRPEVENRR